jgi:hypothetical protein
MVSCELVPMEFPLTVLYLRGSLRSRNYFQCFNSYISFLGERVLTWHWTEHTRTVEQRFTNFSLKTPHLLKSTLHKSLPQIHFHLGISNLRASFSLTEHPLDVAHRDTDGDLNKVQLMLKLFLKYYLKFSSLFPYVNCTFFLNFLHVSILHNHLQGMWHIKGNVSINVQKNKGYKISSYELCTKC